MRPLNHGRGIGTKGTNQTVEASIMSEDLLEGDAPMPEPATWDSPEKRLMFVVFHDGIMKALNGCEADQEWVLSDRHDYFTSFVGLCELFNLPAEVVRRKLQAQWKAGERGSRWYTHQAGNRARVNGR